jgi:hypothetical protein
MALTFQELKKNRQKSFQKITEEIEKQNSSSFQDDDRVWYPATDKAGNGSAVIRFLPAPADEEVPFVRLWYHSFQGPGGWYIENSLTTIGQQDPIAELNNELWNSTTDDESPARKTVRKQKRKLVYISNVFIISDPANPENEGKVKIFKFGKKLYDKIHQAMYPEFEDETPMNPFDLWDGADFKIKIRQVEGYRNYDNSKFGERKSLFDNDEEIEAVWKQTYSVKEFVAEDKFKTYDELKKSLERALKKKLDKSEAANLASSDQREMAAPKLKEIKSKSLEEDDDTADFFKNLLNDNEDEVPFQ